MPRSLTDVETSTFEYIRQTRGCNIALVNSTYEGREVAVICAVSHEADNSVVMQPLAMLLDDNDFDKLTPP